MDQFSQYNSLMRKSRKWWKKLFFYLVNLTLVNSFVLYKKFAIADKKKDHYGFRNALVCALLEEAGDVACRDVRRGRPILQENPTRLSSRCFPEYIPAKPGAKRQRPCRDCVVCNPKKKDRQGHKRVQTSYWCPDCKVAMCPDTCFKAYHKLKNYRNENVPQ